MAVGSSSATPASLATRELRLIRWLNRPTRFGATAPPRFSLASTARSAVRSRRSEEHTSELQSLMRISYAVFCLKKKKDNTSHNIGQTIFITTEEQNKTLHHNTM